MRFLEWSFVGVVCLGVAAGAVAQTVDVNPAGDVWFYKNFPTSRTDPFMNCWGGGTTDLDPTWPPGDFYSYSYVKFDLGGAFDPSKVYTVVRAVLTLHQLPNAGYSGALANDHPLLARGLGDGWEEDTYAYGAGNPAPGALLGSGDMSAYDQANGYAVPIDLVAVSQTDIDLLFNEAVQGSDRINFALTTTLQPSGPSGTEYYSLGTKDGAPDFYPRLTLTAEVVPEPGTLGAVFIGAALLGLRLRRK